MRDKLFHVQDSDCPMYVLASCWSDALDKWRSWIRSTQDLDADEPLEPSGIALVCGADELLT